MTRTIFPVLSLAAFLLLPARAIEMNGGYDTTAPTDADIADWTTGWGAAGITGWDYVGQVNGNSAVYLGNGWVLTAGHVGFGDFVLGDNTYAAIAGSGQFIDPNATTGTSADLYVFQITTPPDLPSLTLSLDLPVAFSATQAGSSVVMLGYGGSSPHLSWGLDTVTQINQTVNLTGTPNNLPFISNDFLTVDGTTTYGSSSINNTSKVTGGDSGGGDFTFDATTGTWELIGINEVTGSGTDGGHSITYSGMVQLDTYATQIEAITGVEAVPEPSAWLLVGLGLASVWGWSRRRSFVSHREQGIRPAPEH